jgi:hypothetical protein
MGTVIPAAVEVAAEAAAEAAPAVDLVALLLAGVRPIPGWPGYYATAEGEILSVRTGRPVILATTAHPTRGHLKVKLYREGCTRGVDHFVHRLICLAWHGEPCEGADLALHGPNHDPTDNRPENLRWGSRGENERDRRWFARRPEEVDYWERHERAQALAGQLGIYVPDPRWGF